MPRVRIDLPVTPERASLPEPKRAYSGVSRFSLSNNSHVKITQLPGRSS